MDKKRKSSQHTETMKEFDIRIERPKPSPVEELISLLRRILQYCLCIVTCGCVQVPPNGNSLNGEEYGTMLLDSEKIAVENLLSYLETDAGQVPVISDEHLHALQILTYSDNEELQRSAALCFVEISERMQAPLTESMAQPLVELLKSSDVLVQKTASLAVSNFALNGPEVNKDVLVSCDVLSPLVNLLNSKNTEVQCNTCGSITTLATAESLKQKIICENGIKPLLTLLSSPDLRVQRNAAGAILNLTHSQSNRNELVSRGALPALVEQVFSPDEEIQYYCTAALSNIAVHEKHRAMMVAIGDHDILKQMINFLQSKREKIRCQACFALRNLASDGDNQLFIVKYGALPLLNQIIRTAKSETLGASVGCLRNLSILKANEQEIVREDFLPDLCRILTTSHNSEAQKHAAGTIRNLSVGEEIQAVLESSCLDALMTALLEVESRMSVHADITAALAVLADEDSVKDKLLTAHRGKVFFRLVSLASLCNNLEVQYNSAGIIGQLALKGIPDHLQEPNRLGIVLYIDKFLKSKNPNFIHIALWTLIHLLKEELFITSFKEHHIGHIINHLLMSGQPPAIIELAENVQKILKTSAGKDCEELSSGKD
ncbi:vacuolar protein 8-like [Gigantopelta aegis]|uniref:vacuolar protein 8-like n=1 Tax=Gigantopelta aegis TaxID=1735272 RepID=UPI001B88CD51|nr:vacuolar protein 8-like [Gigantopelta aegis]